jgi:hypothetical protein
MHHYDPLQTQLSMGAYSGGAFPGTTNPFGLPSTALQSAFNPAAFNPLIGLAQAGAISPFGQQGNIGVPNYGAIAQQLQQQQQQQQLQQLAAILAQQGLVQQGLAQQGFGQQGFGQQGWGQQGMVPQQIGISPQVNPWQNQFIAQNPLVAALQNPLLNPILAQQLALQAVSQQYAQPQLGQTQYGQLQQYGQPQFGQTWPVHTQFGQIGSPFGQTPYGQAGMQTGYPLAPQSWVGQAGLSQLAGRGLY